MASVTLEKVSKTYGKNVHVVRELDLHVDDGQFVTLVGPSGCGKSTTLHMIAGLDHPTSGTVRIGDRAVNDLSPKDRDVAMVFQSYALYPHMNVRRNIAFPLENAGVERREIERRVAETASMLGIDALLHRRPRELSGGQRQRVALGRALVRRPRVFLFDEPLSNLDAELRTQMRSELKKLHETLGATFVYVTHDQAEAMTLSDRVVVLHEGRIQQHASPRDIYERPENTFVASFLGSPRINLVAPAVLGLDAGGRSVVAGLRPEDLRCVPDGAAAGSTIDGTVYVTEPTGAVTWVTLEAGGERLVAQAPRDFAGRSGDRVSAHFDRARVLYFDSRSGERIREGS